MSGEHAGHNFGYGSYFAIDSSYSHCYTKIDGGEEQFMFLARVLVGSYTMGQSTYRTPPPKEPSNPESDLYDSCVDDTVNPTTFVIFDIDQCYPEYIIKYFTLENCPTLSPHSAYLTGANTTALGYIQRNLANPEGSKSSLTPKKNLSSSLSPQQTATTSGNSHGISPASLRVSSKYLEAQRRLASSTLSVQRLNTAPRNSQEISSLSSQRVLSISTPNLQGSSSSKKNKRI